MEENAKSKKVFQLNMQKEEYLKQMNGILFTEQVNSAVNEAELRETIQDLGISAFTLEMGMNDQVLAQLKPLLKVSAYAALQELHAQVVAIRNSTKKLLYTVE